MGSFCWIYFGKFNSNVPSVTHSIICSSYIDCLKSIPTQQNQKRGKMNFKLHRTLLHHWTNINQTLQESLFGYPFSNLLKELMSKYYKFPFNTDKLFYLQCPILAISFLFLITFQLLPIYYYIITQVIDLGPYQPSFLEQKTWCQKEKLLVLSNFFFSRHVFKKLSAAEASESNYMRERVNRLQ